MIYSILHKLSKKIIFASILAIIVNVAFFVLLWNISIYGYTLDLQNKLITDQAWVLSESEESYLEQQLLNIEKDHNTQIAIITLQNLWWEDPAQVAVDIAQSNGIGKDGIDSGAIILISLDERKWRIETGYWLEWPIPDILANRLGQNILAPAFRRWEYAWGLSEVITIMWELLDGEFDGFVEPNKTEGIDADLFGAFLIYGAMAMFFFGSIYRAIQKDTKKRTTWIFVSGASLWLIALVILWWWAFILLFIYIIAGLFGWFAEQWWRLRWSRWMRWFWGFGSIRGGSFGGWGFGGFGGWSFGGWWAWGGR